MHLGAEAAVELEKALHQERGQQERHGESKRIYREEESSFDQRALLRGDGKNSRQNRAQARSPAESKGEPNHKCPERSAAAFHVVQASVCIESLDLENARKVQS